MAAPANGATQLALTGQRITSCASVGARVGVWPWCRYVRRGARLSWRWSRRRICLDVRLLRTGSFGPLLGMELPDKRRLTRREEEVVELVGRGLTNAEIAQSLGLSPWTIKRHVARLLGKTGARRRVDLAVRYFGLREEQPPTEPEG